MNGNTNKDNEIILINNSNLSKIYKNNKLGGLSGLVNMGNSCYMNSAIQVLSHNYLLISYLFNNKDEIIQILTRKKYILNNTLTYHLINLIENIWDIDCVIVPISFKTIFSDIRNKFFIGNQQHDAEEAYSCIIQQLQEELAENKNINFKIKKQNKLFLESYDSIEKYYKTNYSGITEIFTGFLYSSITCPNCSFVSNAFEPYLSLSLPISKNHIYDCLIEFNKIETLDNNNLWLCDKCNNNVSALKKIEIWTAPPILVIQFKRFNSLLHKNNSFIDYPLNNFDIKMITSKHQNINTTYKLISVINHIGNINGGHYYSYCINEELNKWYEFDDSEISEISINNIITNNAYMLYYIRCDLL